MAEKGGKSWADETEEEAPAPAQPNAWGNVQKPTDIADLHDPNPESRNIGPQGGGYEQRDGGGYDRGYNERRGGYEERRGGYEDRRGGYEDRRGGGYEDRRGGGYEDRHGGGGGGGYEDRRGGYDNRRGGYDRPQREKLPIPTNPPYTLFCGNLPFHISEDDLASFFDGLAISNVRLMRDRETGALKGFGYVEFETQQALTDALTADGLQMAGRGLRLDVAAPPRERHDGGGFGRRGGGGDNWRRNEPASDDPIFARSSGGEERPHFALKPRTSQDAPLQQSKTHTRADPFAGARPRDERKVMEDKEKERAERAAKLEAEAKARSETEGSEAKDAEQPEGTEQPPREERPRQGRRQGGYGYDQRRGGYDQQRGGYDQQRGGYDRQRGGYDQQRGGYDQQRGGYDRRGGGGRRDYGGGRRDHGDNRSWRDGPRDQPAAPQPVAQPTQYDGLTESNE